MSGDNTNVGLDRRVIWEGQGGRFAIEESEAGDIMVMRSGSADDGPSRSIMIPSDALASVTAWLWVLCVRRIVSGVGQAMARAQEELRKLADGRKTLASAGRCHCGWWPCPVHQIDDISDRQPDSSSVDLGQGCAP